MQLRACNLTAGTRCYSQQIAELPITYRQTDIKHSKVTLLCCINVDASGKYEAVQSAMLTAEQFHSNNVGLILFEKQITN